MWRLLVALLGLIVPLGGGDVCGEGCILSTIPICGRLVAIRDVLAALGFGYGLLMAAPCRLRDDGTSVIPEDYRLYGAPLQTSRPLDGVWIPMTKTLTEAMQADYRRRWNRDDSATSP